MTMKNESERSNSTLPRPPPLPQPRRLLSMPPKEYHAPLVVSGALVSGVIAFFEIFGLLPKDNSAELETLKARVTVVEAVCLPRYLPPPGAGGATQ